MRALLRRLAIGFSSGALAALAAVVLVSLLGRAKVGPAQFPLVGDFLLSRVAAGGTWGLALAAFLGMHWTRVLLAGLAVGLAPGLQTWLLGGAWPLADGPWAPAWLLGGWLLWGFLAGLVAAWLGEPAPAPSGRGRKR